MKIGCMLLLVIAVLLSVVVIGCGGGGGGTSSAASYVPQPKRCPEAGYITFVSLNDPSTVTTFLENTPGVDATALADGVYMLVHKDVAYDIPVGFTVLGGCTYTESGTAIQL